MSRLMYSLMMLAFICFFSSCSDKKQVPGGVIEETGDPVITYQIQGFGETSQTESALSQSADVNNLYYFVFSKADGKFVKQKMWNNGNDVKLINDTLPEGDYYISFLASTSTVDFRSDVDYLGYPFGMTYPDIEFYYKSLYQEEIFYETFELNAQEKSIQKQVTIPRVVGKVEIEALDAASIPDDVTRIYAAIGNKEGEYSQGSLPSGMNFKTKKTVYESWDYTKTMTDSNMDRAGFLNMTESGKFLSFYLFPTTGENKNDDTNPCHLYVIIEKGGKTVDILIKKDIDIDANKVTHLSGNLFDKLEEGFDYGSISVEDAWDETVYDTFD